METDGPKHGGAEPEPAPDSAPGGGGGRGPGRGRRREPWSLRKKSVVWGSTGLAAVLVLGSVGFTVAWNHLNGNIRTEGADLRPSSINGKQDILFIGSDSRAGANEALGGGTVVGARSDTTMIFDSPADRRKGTEVSIPRDSMVRIPQCTGGGGATVAANFGMFNSAFTSGGAPCTVRTVQSLTGLPLTHYIVVDFEGVVGVVNALGGVKVCVTQPIDDPDSHLDLPAGTTTLNGQQALAFVRVRHSLGNGSDLQRIQRQQYFIDQLSAQVRADGLLSDPVKLYRVLDAATSAIQTDPGLGSVSQLYGLAQTLNSIPTGTMRYVTVPTEPYPGNPDRVVWSEPAATTLWNGLINEPDSAGAAASAGAAVGLGPEPGPIPRAAPSAPALPGLSRDFALGGALDELAPIDIPPDRVVPSDEVRAAETLGAFESLMQLALMADTPNEPGTGTADAPSSAAGATTPSGVGTCPVT